MEGNTYAARWKKQGEKFLVYLDDDKTLKGSDIDFETACVELCLGICDRYSDGEAVLKQVGVKGGKYNSLTSWKCQYCGHKSFSCTHPEMPDNDKYSDFCSKSDLPGDLSEAFVIEDNIGRKMVCMSLNRWHQLNNHKKAKGVSAGRIYVLPDEQVERNPSLRIESNAN